jgi:peptidoglycan/xylan/chitin deacetylase (PgdA/CDA1 family)
VPAERTKQVLKNGLYRALGETHTALNGRNGHGEPRLRVLMYHKVNDRPHNPVTVPTTLFAEQMDQLRDLGYAVVGLDDVLAWYRTRAALPPKSVLITFDDGYGDVLEHALPALSTRGYPAVVFVPVGCLGGRTPLPHERRLAARGLVNRTLDWAELAELEAGGVRVESHGISHRPLSELEIDDAACEIALSKLRLEERLGRPVEAFAYVKGAQAHYEPAHVSLVRQAGYELAFTSVSGANTWATDRLRLRRYNVEPYPPRTFELVLAGACDLIGVKDTVPGTHTRRLVNAVLGTSSE